MRATTLMTILIWPVLLSAQSAERKQSVGFRDPIIFGLSLGTMNGLAGGFQSQVTPSTAIRMDGAWGGGVARWGIAEQWQVNGLLIHSVSDDRVNNALFVEPGLMYGAMYGDSIRTFLDFSPGATVHFVGISCAVAWVHEFTSWSTELVLQPGEALALDGANPGQAFGWGSDANFGASARGEYSFQLSLLLLAHF